MGRKSRTKGKTGELELVHLAKDMGFPDAERRAPMQCAEGDKTHPDVAALGRIWAEVKRHARVNVQGNMRELLAVERPGWIRVLFHRSDRGPLLATLEASELLKLERDALECRIAVAENASLRALVTARETGS